MFMTPELWCLSKIDSYLVRVDWGIILTRRKHSEPKWHLSKKESEFYFLVMKNVLRDSS